MKKLLLSLLPLLLILLLVGCGDDAAPPITSSSVLTAPSGNGDNPSAVPEGSPDAYDFKMQDLDGNELSLSDLTDKPIVLNFWASWCPPCKAEMPALEAAYRKYGDNINFVMISVDDTREAAKSFYDSSVYSFPAYFDHTGFASYLYDISSIPQTFFISTNGKIISSHIGAITSAQLDSAINALRE